ncbi:hypothetical protein [uncultured Sphingobacterium sp.]|jgi:hypothetical protein|uniref:hypothetical protein n=1 Tax=uncultured Sphingobacterium sp. TaxID=182688 RepID=UPI003749D6F1
MRKILILFALFLFAQSNSANAQSNSIKGCIANFLSDAHSGNTSASSNYQSCISKVPGTGGGAGNGAGGGQEQGTPEGDPEPHDDGPVHYTFNQILDVSSISSINSPSQQIVEFEYQFAVALSVIRNVNTVGETPEQAMNSYLSYVFNNNLINHFYSQANFSLIPSLGWDILFNYANNGNSILPPSWAALGYYIN